MIDSMLIKKDVIYNDCRKIERCAKVKFGVAITCTNDDKWLYVQTQHKVSGYCNFDDFVGDVLMNIRYGLYSD